MLLFGTDVTSVGQLVNMTTTAATTGKSTTKLQTPSPTPTPSTTSMALSGDATGTVFGMWTMINLIGIVLLLVV
jgi:hypothetical protein